MALYLGSVSICFCSYSSYLLYNKYKNELINTENNKQNLRNNICCTTEFSSFPSHGILKVPSCDNFLFKIYSIDKNPEIENNYVKLNTSSNRHIIINQPVITEHIVRKLYSLFLLHPTFGYTNLSQSPDIKFMMSSRPRKFTCNGNDLHSYMKGTYNINMMCDSNKLFDIHEFNLKNKNLYIYGHKHNNIFEYTHLSDCSEKLIDHIANKSDKSDIYITGIMCSVLGIIGSSFVVLSNINK